MRTEGTGRQIAGRELPRWRLPVTLLVVIAFLGGVVLVTGSLTYAPQGRINVVVLVLLWGVLPAAGSLGALIWAVRGAPTPWVVRSGPATGMDAAFIWRTGSQLQWLWGVFAAGMVLGYFLNLLFLDLAFAWSSTLLETPDVIRRMTDVVSLPWAAWWPEARPSLRVIEMTRFERISPDTAAGEEARAWWPFLLMVLLCYNLLPRLVLGACFAGLARFHQRHHAVLSIRGTKQSDHDDPADVRSPPAQLQRDSRRNWEQAEWLYWGGSMEAPEHGVELGRTRWQQDLATVRQVVRESTGSVVWSVDGHQTPVADLSDLIVESRRIGCSRQGLWVVGAEAGSHYEQSWESFAMEMGLIWLTEDPQGVS